MGEAPMDRNDEGDVALSTLLHDHATRHRPSPGFEARLRAALAAEAAALTPADDRARETAAQPVRRRWSWSRRWPAWTLAGGGFVSGAALASLLMLSAGPVWRATPATAPLADELVSGHVRALMPGHLSDVVSTDQHTVKPWFQGRLDYSPPVVNPAEAGFPLEGGRLDYIDGRPVAALVYRRHSHVINVFVWPASSSTSPAPELDSRRGYNVLHWADGGMQFWAVSDLNAEELGTLSHLLR